jgi:hypothetical protein
VLVVGRVKGADREADCEVLARRITVGTNDGLSQRPYTYTDCSVIKAPADLPGGEYAVDFDGHEFQATRRRGVWITSGSSVRCLEASDATFTAS